jgi:hypothetical protein
MVFPTMELKRLLMPVILDARSPQPSETVLVDRLLPGEVFLDGQQVAAAGFVKGEETTPYGRDHLCLPPNDPTFRVWRRQVADCQWAAIRTDDVFGPSKRFYHDTLTHFEQHAKSLHVVY